MKKALFPAALLVIGAAGVTFAQTPVRGQTQENSQRENMPEHVAATAALSAEERAQAIKYLRETREQFLTAIAKLSEAQWTFKPAPDRWSIADIAEHIGLSERLIIGMIQTKIMKSPAAPEQRAEARGKDQIILKVIPDRAAGAAQAPEVLKPTGTWATRELLIRDFEATRAGTIAYVSDTKESLRDHFAPHPVLKTLDAYQWLLFLAAHSERHTRQILDVKADPRFPRN